MKNLLPKEIYPAVSAFFSFSQTQSLQSRRLSSNTGFAKFSRFGLLSVGFMLVGLSSVANANIDLIANEQPVRAQPNAEAISKIPADYQFVEPGTLTVALSVNNSPPNSLLATDNKTRIGSDADIARLIADSLGLKVNLIATAWEDWPLGLTSGRYDIALINIAVTEERKKKFDFATYRQDSLAFSVGQNSKIESINKPEDIAGLKIIVSSGTNQEKILLGWNEENTRAGIAPAELVYLTDDASANLFIQSGRADAMMGPQAAASYKAALNGKTRVVGLGPKKAYVAVTTKKDNQLVYAVQAALNGIIESGEYQQVLARWGQQAEGVPFSEVNPAGITY